MSAQNRIGFILAAVVAISALAVVLTHGSGASAAGRTDNVNVQCGPAQRAVVHQADAAGSITVECVDVQPTPVAPSANMQTPPTAWAPAPAAMAAPMTPVATATPVAMAPTPAVYYPAAPAAVVETPRQVRASAPAREARTSSKPSTKKRLMIIGGSAGAGAGIGALVGGKKGALIGAAIGGGGAAVVDQIRNDND